MQHALREQGALLIYKRNIDCDQTALVGRNVCINRSSSFIFLTNRLFMIDPMKAQRNTDNQRYCITMPLRWILLFKTLRTQSSFHTFPYFRMKVVDIFISVEQKQTLMRTGGMGRRGVGVLAQKVVFLLTCCNQKVASLISDSS